MPYTPVTFAVLPVPKPSDRANPPAGQQAQATVLDANFGLLNTELAKQGSSSAFAYRQPCNGALTGQANFGSLGVWNAFGSTFWAALSFTVPECAALLVTIGANLYNRTSSTAQMWARIVASGPGARAAVEARVATRAAGGQFSATAIWLPGVDINIGAALTLSPQYYISAKSAQPMGISDASFHVIALV